MEQTFESVKELPTYENVRAGLINIKPKTFVDFSVTPNINFADDLWTFDEFKRFSDEDWAYNYDFTQLDTTYKNYAKYMILRELFNKHLRFTTVKKKFYCVRDLIYYLSEHHMFYPNLIDVPFLKGFLVDVLSERNLADKKQTIKMFLSEIELRVPGVNFSDCYNYLNKHNRRKIKIERERGKHKFVSINIHNKIISLAIQDLRNEDLPITQRAAACMIVLLTDTGMRIGEFRILEVDRLEEISVESEHEIFYYLNFKTYKTVKEKEYKWTRSFITENALLAYKTLTEIYRERRKSQYLFVNDKGTEVSKVLLRMRLVQFFYRHQSQLQLDKIVDHEVSQFAVTRKRNFKLLRFVPDNEMDKDIFYVTFHQYRVVLATILHNKGYHLDFIRQHMNHLTEEMTQHYIRFKEIKKLEVNAVETLRKRSTKDGLKLNTDINEASDKHIREELRSEEYQEIYDQINKFLKNNKLNIFTDIDEIVYKISRTDNPIADMELGICAKSFNKLCERNQYISSINDAYYLGVQIHSLDDLPFSIKRFQEKASIVAYNENLYKKNPKYRNEFERELKGIKKYIERKLNPELMLLKDEIGSEGVHNKYPNLAEIIGNINDIEKEVQKWNAKTL
ncbi:tyrosine-type recombinase/integrase [Bacillus cereus]|uniref:tyrosine-type recombinase/integrase n=1 Tax=Bacillus cereus TaxID=1396 RepID=UPI0018F6254F|nr:tyrosine-type recombinase/integrase [Bacillus cereus]MBJ8054422.1 tyrosine-type recombinase/integrase [Bacillus cereus]